MGNCCGNLSFCFSGGGGAHKARRRKDSAGVIPEPSDDLGHSFLYVRPESRVGPEASTTTFKLISGASVSANTSTPLSTDFIDSPSASVSFESSNSFASIPLQPIPRSSSLKSGPLSTSGLIHSSGPIERARFLSGPIEGGFLSGSLDRRHNSGPLEKGCSGQFQRSFSHNVFPSRQKSRKELLICVLQNALAKTIIKGQSSTVAPIKDVKENDVTVDYEKEKEIITSSVSVSRDSSFDDYDSVKKQNLEWAQGKAGEDRVHVVVSEENGWVFVGIYDGFNGPDATDYLLSNLYSAVHQELKGLLWEDKFELSSTPSGNLGIETKNRYDIEEVLEERSKVNNFFGGLELEAYPNRVGEKKEKVPKNKYIGVAKKEVEKPTKWRYEFDRQRLELDSRLKEELYTDKPKGSRMINHLDVLKALAQALKKTEQAYLDLADKLVTENPELALMGSCVLVMLMKGEDVYVMNVGDSRAVLAQKKESDLCNEDSERIKEENLHDLESVRGDRSRSDLASFQLTIDHSTSMKEEVRRVKNEHPDDVFAVTKNRVKGSLRVTRAFGAGFLKQPKWNDALLKIFRVDYVGNSPYINCIPSLYHHQLGSRDKFLILSSDGLYEYFTNEEAVSEVEQFINCSPDGDPAQHLVQEVMFRAAKKAGIDFHELLEIPQGDKRRYHDDVSIIVISFEGRIWRSCL